MAIVKRLTPKDRLSSRTDGSWTAMLKVPIIAQLVNTTRSSHVDPSPDNISQVVSQFLQRDWITKAGWQERIFVYIYGMVARRAEVPGLLDDERMTQLARHMNAQTTIDKIDHNEVSIGLVFRMAFVFDLPDFLLKYKSPGSLTLSKPIAAAPAKPLRKRLEKHRK